MDEGICSHNSLLTDGSSWIKHLPQYAYGKAAELLTDFGIFEKAQQSGAVDLARSIETILKAANSRQCRVCRT
jgi:hypothetical protein